MRKIPRKYENPLDNFNIDLMDKTTPFFRSLKFTPNGITTLSLISGLVSIYYLYHHNFWGFAISYYISYLFDCLDGHYARKYKMVSKLGDLYDHTKDVLITISVIFILLFVYRNSPKTKIIFCILTIILFLLTCMHLGCQEKLYPKQESDTLCFSKKLCISPETTIKFTRWFGCGSFVLYIIIFAYIFIKKVF